MERPCPAVDPDLRIARTARVARKPLGATGAGHVGERQAAIGPIRAARHRRDQPGAGIGHLRGDRIDRARRPEPHAIGARLEQSRHTRAVEIDPLERIHRDRRAVGQRDLPIGPVGRDESGIAELERRQRTGDARAASNGGIGAESDLCDQRQQRQIGAFLIAKPQRGHQQRVAAEVRRKVVEDHDRPAQACGADLEPGGVMRERIDARAPRTDRHIGIRRRGVVVPVIEDRVKVPGERGERRRIERQQHRLGKRPLVAPVDPRDIAVGADPPPDRVERRGDTDGILRPVGIEDVVAPGVVAFLEQPCEDSRRIGGVGDPRPGIDPEQPCDIGRVDHLPAIACRSLPMLDRNERPLQSGAIAARPVGDARDRPGRLAIGDGHQFALRRVDEHVGIVVPRHPLAGLAGDRGQPDIDAAAECAIAAAGLVGERQCRR